MVQVRSQLRDDRIGILVPTTPDQLVLRADSGIGRCRGVVVRCLRQESPYLVRTPEESWGYSTALRRLAIFYLHPVPWQDDLWHISLVRHMVSHARKSVPMNPWFSIQPGGSDPAAGDPDGSPEWAQQDHDAMR